MLLAMVKSKLDDVTLGDQRREANISGHVLTTSHVQVLCQAL